MSTHNSRLRKLREQYRLERAKIRHQYEKKEHEIASKIDMERDERSYWLSKLKIGEELEKAKEQINERTERINQLKLKWIELKFDTRNELIILERDKFMEIDQIEQEARQKGGAES